MTADSTRKSAEMPRRYRIGIIVLVFLVMCVFGIGYTTWVDSRRAEAERVADQRWCQLLNTLDEAYSAVPPTTELGRRVAEAVHQLRTDIGC